MKSKQGGTLFKQIPDLNSLCFEQEWNSFAKIFSVCLDTDFELCELSVAQILAFTIYKGDCIESSTNPIVTGVLYAQNIYQGVSTS